MSKVMNGRGLISMFIVMAVSMTMLTNLFAQGGFVVSGVVSDAKGKPLYGASVEVQGVKRGVITDADGYYEIDAGSKDAVLIYSYVGMKTVEVSVKGRKLIDQRLLDDPELIDEVVVIGYGEVKKSDLTGSVSTVSKKVMSDRVITSLEDAMRGQAAGVSIMQNDGVPGSPFSIKIRGASSVNASSTPIYVIDGVICDNADDFSVADVESIEVMKDASSTAIYGSRGANGVIIITTKRGREGRVKVGFSSMVGVQNAVRPYDMMNTVEYAEMKYQTQWQYSSFANATAAWLGSEDYYYYYRDSQAADANYWRIPKDASYSNYKEYADSTNTDWQAAMFRPAVIQDYRLNISGGGKTSKYSVMASYLNQQGIIVFSGMEKYSARMNYETALTDKFKLTTNLSLSYSSNEGFATGTSYGVTTSMLRQQPTIDLNDNNLGTGDDGAEIHTSSNPYYQAEHITKDKESTAMTLRAVLDYNINKNWLIRVTGTYGYSKTDNYTYYPKTVMQGVKQNGRAIWNVGSTMKLMNENLIYYNKRFNRDHILKVMGGLTFEKYNNTWLNAENQNFQKEDLGANSIGEGTSPIVPTSSRDANPYQMMGVLGRIEYNMLGRYLFTATIRADGSSRFGTSHKWGLFPSGAFAWKVDQEDFIKKATWIDMLKLRASAGTSGNTAIPAFRTLSTMSTAFVPMNGKDVEYGIKLDRPNNQDLRWETTTQFDAGLDFSVFNGLLNLTVDGYLKITDDLLLERNAPYYSGYRKAWGNIGSIQNSGLELTLGSRLIDRKNFWFDASANIAFNRSKVLDIPGDEMYFEATNVLSGAGNFVVVKKGQPLGQWYGFKVDGVYTSQSEIDALLDGYSVFSMKKDKIRPGDHRFVDVDGNGRITTDDRTILGNGEPDFTGGFSFNIGYRNFELSTMFQYSYGADVFNANLASLDAGRENYNQTRHLRNAYVPSLYNLDGTLFYQGNENGKYRMPGGVAENYCLSEFIEDASFLRLSDVTLSYTFGQKVISKLKLTSLKVFVAAKNLYVWTNYFGFDPEVNTKQGNLGDFMPSLDFGSYPRCRTVSLGVNVSF